MKLIAGAALVSCMFFAGGESKLPDLLFHKGATFTYEGQSTFPDVKDARYTCVLRIDEVTVNGVHRSCVAAIGYPSRDGALDKATICRFACDSLNLYVSAANFARRSIFDRETNDSGDSLMYPFSMKVGDTLPDAWYKSNTAEPTVTYASDVRYTNRRVESLDTLKLNIGTITAFRISMTEVAVNTSTSQYTGNQSGTLTRTITEWFSPQYGLVKTQSERDNGLDVLELFSYKAH